MLAVEGPVIVVVSAVGAAGTVVMLAEDAEDTDVPFALVAVMVKVYMVLEASEDMMAVLEATVKVALAPAGLLVSA